MVATNIRSTRASRDSSAATRGTANHPIFAIRDVCISVGYRRRCTAQHLRALSPLRRRATVVATTLATITRLTDDGVSLFDRAVGRMFRRGDGVGAGQAGVPESQIVRMQGGAVMREEAGCGARATPSMPRRSARR
jgi:hypothetical protein